MKKTASSLLPLLSLFSFISTSSMNILTLHNEAKENIFLQCDKERRTNLKLTCKNFNAYYKSMHNEQKKYIKALITSSENPTDRDNFDRLITTQDIRFTDVRNSICNFIPCDDTIENNLKIYSNVEKAFPKIFLRAIGTKDDLITYLCIKQYSSTKKNLIPAFMKAAESEFMSGIMQLLSCGVDVNSTQGYDKIDENGYTALMWAAANGHNDIVEYLCTINGININYHNEYDQSALSLATPWLVTENDCDQDNNWYTSRKKYTNTITILKKAGATTPLCTIL